MQHPGVARLTIDTDNFAVITPRDCRRVHEDVQNLINQMGVASSRAQGLQHIITTFSSFMSSNTNKMYILVTPDHKQTLGFIKVGVRNLFLWDRLGVQHEKQILCLLDFFTYPSCQRKGYGKKMIEKMLIEQHKEMKDIPIDRPSALCLSFMKRHFGLSNYLPQTNNFVVFDQFWESNSIQQPISEFKPISKPHAHFAFPEADNQNIPPKACVPAKVVLKTICNPQTVKKTFNPVTWSVHYNGIRAGK